MSGHSLVFRSAIRLLPIAILIYLLVINYPSPSLLFLSYQEQQGTDVEAEFRKSHMKHPPPLKLIDFKDIHRDDFDFSMVSGKSVMVFLHIQKTGGSAFSRHLVKDIDLDGPCNCSNHELKNDKATCGCLRPGKSGELELFSRFSTGWKCGVHADWAEWMSCRLFKEHRKRYFFMTFLRDPVMRFLSEFEHVRRQGAPWKAATLRCKGQGPTAKELPPCPEHLGVSLEEFLGCGSNLAFNRGVISQNKKERI